MPSRHKMTIYGHGKVSSTHMAQCHDSRSPTKRLYARGGQPLSVCVPKSAKSMTKFFHVPTMICGEGSEFWAPVIGGYGVRLIRLCF